MIEVKTELHRKNEARQATSPEEPARQPLNSQSFPENFLWQLSYCKKADTKEGIMHNRQMNSTYRKV